MYEDIKNHCGIDSESRLLEIGAGSGIATVELAQLGCHIVAIEPGAQLATIAREQTDRFDKVRIHVSTLEDFHTNDKFDCILAFTAFHWLSEGDRFDRIARLLNRTGSLVLVWNSFFQNDMPVFTDVNRVFQELIPDIYPETASVTDVNNGVLSKLNRREQEVVSSELFIPVYLRKYLTTYNYDDVTYTNLLNTYPKIISIDENRRTEFLGRIAEVVRQHGGISATVMTTLIVSQQRDSILETVTHPKGGNA